MGTYHQIFEQTLPVPHVRITAKFSTAPKRLEERKLQHYRGTSMKPLVSSQFMYVQTMVVYPQIEDAFAQRWNTLRTRMLESEKVLSVSWSQRHGQLRA